MSKPLDYYEDSDAEFFIGKYAYNKVHNIGGYISYIDNHQVIIDGMVFTTITGNCPFDSININGFEIYNSKDDLTK